MGKIHVDITVRPETKAELRRQARERGMTMGEYVEHLVANADPDRQEYFLRQAAVQSFIAASLITVMAGHSLPGDQVLAYRDRAARIAREIFGEAPRRRFDVPRGEEAYDPRIAALFDAYGAG